MFLCMVSGMLVVPCGGVTIPEDMVRRETENVVALTPAQEEVEGLVQKVTLLEGELAEAC
jgi:hypothetical protein